MKIMAIYVLAFIIGSLVLYVNFLWHRGFANYMQEAAKKHLVDGMRDFQINGGITKVRGYYELTDNEKELTSQVIELMGRHLYSKHNNKTVPKLLAKTSMIHVELAFQLLAGSTMDTMERVMAFVCLLFEDTWVVRQAPQIKYPLFQWKTKEKHRGVFAIKVLMIIPVTSDPKGKTLPRQ